MLVHKVPLRRNGRGAAIDRLARFFDGVYLGTGRLLKLAIPEDPGQLRALMRSHEHSEPCAFCDEHPVLRVAARLERYNFVFYLTQRADAAYSLDLESLERQQREVRTEEELLCLMPEGELLTVHPLYESNLVSEPHRFGARALTGVMNYLRYRDRYHVDNAGPAAIQALEFLTQRGLLRKLRHLEHPPVTVQFEEVLVADDPYPAQLAFKDVKIQVIETSAKAIPARVRWLPILYGGPYARPVLPASIPPRSTFLVVFRTASDMRICAHAPDITHPKWGTRLQAFVQHLLWALSDRRGKLPQTVFATYSGSVCVDI